MKKLPLLFFVLLFSYAVILSSCSSFEKSNIKGGKASIEKDGVIISVEVQTKDSDAVESE